MVLKDIDKLGPCLLEFPFWEVGENGEYYSFVNTEQFIVRILFKFVYEEILRDFSSLISISFVIIAEPVSILFSNATWLGRT